MRAGVARHRVEAHRRSPNSGTPDVPSRPLVFPDRCPGRSLQVGTNGPCRTGHRPLPFRPSPAGTPFFARLWPFGPVALVYDVADTDGEPLPDGVSPFTAIGSISSEMLGAYAKRLAGKHIVWNPVDAGAGHAGSIRCTKRAANPSDPSQYHMNVNSNHEPSVQFATVVHELAHLFLGHLGKDKYLSVPVRLPLSQAQRELEAESVSYLVCARNGVETNAETYLSNYVQQETSIESLDLYQIMRAAGQAESVLGLTAHTKMTE